MCLCACSHRGNTLLEFLSYRTVHVAGSLSLCKRHCSSFAAACTTSSAIVTTRFCWLIVQRDMHIAANVYSVCSLL